MSIAMIRVLAEPLENTDRAFAYVRDGWFVFNHCQVATEDEAKTVILEARTEIRAWGKARLLYTRDAWISVPYLLREEGIPFQEEPFPVRLHHSSAIVIGRDWPDIHRLLTSKGIWHWAREIEPQG